MPPSPAPDALEVTPMSLLATAEASWRESAVCHGASAGVFYPPSTTETRDERAARESAARALCAQCPVRETCLEYALQVQEPYGIWGGLNELERRRLLRRRHAS